MNDLERQLAIGNQRPQLVAATPAASESEQARLNENLLLVTTELDAPRESRLARLLRRMGVPDLTVPLVTATPALRRSWFSAVAIAVLFALTTASNNTGVGVDRIAVFLTLAPLVPLLGVALAFGKGVDPTHDLVVAAPRDTFSVFLIRSVTVLVASATVLLLTSAVLPAGGFYRVAWLMPAVAVTAIALALSAYFSPRRVALIVGLTWLLTVIIVSGAASVGTMFGPGTQIAAAAVAVGAGWFVYSQRDRFEAVEAGT